MGSVRLDDPSYGPFAGVRRDSSTSVNEIRSTGSDGSLGMREVYSPGHGDRAAPMSDPAIVRR